MTGDYTAVTIDQYRVSPAELPDRRRYLRHLRLTMRPGVPGMRDQLIDRQVLNPQFSGHF